MTAADPGRNNAGRCATWVSIALLALVSACGVPPQARRGESGFVRRFPADETNARIDRHAMLESIMRMMSVPYLYAGNDASGIDCSGFVAMIYRAAGHPEVPRSVREQSSAGRAVPMAELQFGDLLFFDIEGDGPSHVGIYIGDGLFAHASLSRGVMVSLLDAEYFRRHLVAARRMAG